MTSGTGWSDVLRTLPHARPPARWSGHRPGSGRAAPPPAGPGGWRGTGVEIVAAELGAQVDQQPGPNLQQPVTAQPPIGPDRPDALLVDHPLDREPGRRAPLL